MVRSELIKHSPLRILDASTNGGVGKGNVGVMAARHGVGKTSALVHIATDKLLQGKHVIHVTFASRTVHIIDYYEEIFTEISKVKDLAGGDGHPRRDQSSSYGHEFRPEGVDDRARH